MTVWLTLVAAGLGTLGLRSAVPLLAASRGLPAGIDRLGALVAPAMLAALAGATTSPFAGDGTGAGFVAAIVAGGVAAYRTRRPAPGIAVGLSVGLAAGLCGI
jgi:hypothetical protein